MTLHELSTQYRRSAAAIRERIEELEARYPWSTPDESQVLDARIRVLASMWRQTRDIAVLCEHYYERGYRRNGRYTI